MGEKEIREKGIKDSGIKTEIRDETKETEEVKEIKEIEENKKTEEEEIGEEETGEKEAGRTAERSMRKKPGAGGRKLALWTKYLLDVMFYGGIAATATLPVSIKLIGDSFPRLITHYEETVIIYFVLGVSAVILIRELRKIFRTVLEEDCFVQENVVSLQKMGNWSFFIALMSVVRSIVYMTMAMLVVILVFVVAGLFSKVLAGVFEQAVRYKEENDLTI